MSQQASQKASSTLGGDPWSQAANKQPRRTNKQGRARRYTRTHTHTRARAHARTQARFYNSARPVSGVLGIGQSIVGGWPWRDERTAARAALRGDRFPPLSLRLQRFSLYWCKESAPLDGNVPHLSSMRPGGVSLVPFRGTRNTSLRLIQDWAPCPTVKQCNTDRIRTDVRPTSSGDGGRSSTLAYLIYFIFLLV